MVPKWVRGNESAEIVEPARHPMVMLGLGDSVGTAGRRHPGGGARRPQLRRARCEGRVGARQDRPLQRAVHQLRRDGALPVRRAVAGGAARRRRHADSRRRPSRPAHAAHRRAAVRQRRAARFRRPRSPPRMPTGCSAWPTAASKIVVRLKMEAHFDADAESANVVGEIRGREKPGRSRRRQRPPRFVGRRRRRDRRWRRLRGDVGSAAHHEEAEPAAAAHRARGALDQRGERRPRRPRLSRSASRRARAST